MIAIIGFKQISRSPITTDVVGPLIGEREAGGGEGWEMIPRCHRDRKSVLISMALTRGLISGVLRTTIHLRTRVLRKGLTRALKHILDKRAEPIDTAMMMTLPSKP